MKTKSKRWTISAFAYVIDTARVNAGTLFSLKKNTDPRRLNSFLFGLDLARSLVLPLLQRRNRNGLQKNILKKMDMCLDSIKQHTSEDTVAVENPYDQGQALDVQVQDDQAQDGEVLDVLAQGAQDQGGQNVVGTVERFPSTSENECSLY